jgi:hypothetical protein
MNENFHEPVDHDPFARRVLERIDSEHMRPRPRWEFVGENYLFWILGAVAVALGAVAFSAALFEIESADWSLYAATHVSFWAFFLAVAPFLWAAALLVFIGIGYINIKKTRRGYRYPLTVIAIGAILTSVSLGTALYASGFGEIIEESPGSALPFYRPILSAERAWWQAPEQGVLAGEVLSVASDTGSFVLRDLSGEVRTVDADDLRAADLKELVVGATVRVVGAPTSSTTESGIAFHACFVFPWNFPPPPPPVVATSSERTSAPERSDECKGIRPYGALRALHGE